jgi:hypothetical protein
MSTYYTKLSYKDRYFDIGIKPLKNDGYDIEVRVKGRLSGDDFQGLRKYLDEEGFLEAARNFINN